MTFSKRKYRKTIKLNYVYVESNEGKKAIDDIFDDIFTRIIKKNSRKNEKKDDIKSINKPKAGELHP